MPAKKETARIYKDKLTQKIMVSGKPLKRGMPRYRDHVVTYVCGQLVQGHGLDTILPALTDDELPSLIDFMDILTTRDSWKQTYERAKQIRHSLTEERLITAVQKYMNSPDPSDKEALKAMNTALEVLKKGSVSQDKIQIQVFSNLPKGFWDGHDKNVVK